MEEAPLKYAYKVQWRILTEKIFVIKHRQKKNSTFYWNFHLPWNGKTRWCYPERIQHYNRVFWNLNYRVLGIIYTAMIIQSILHSFF